MTATLPSPTTQTQRADRPAPVEAPRQPEPQVRRRLSQVRLSDVLALVGAGGAAVGTTWLFTQLMPITGVFAPVVIGYALFLLYYSALVSLDESGQTVRARVASVVIHSIALLMLSVLALVVVYCIVRGYKAMLHWNFYTQDMANTGPLDPLSVGGIMHAIAGTLEQITIALAITVPLGIICAVYLNEFPGRFARFVRTIVEAMTALPSIVAGLFIYATFIITLGNDKSGFAAALALGVMMLPIIIRAADVVLRLVPGHLKEASYALGSSHWRTVWHVVLPTSRSGLTTAVILGTARGIGETSPVLLTAGFNNAMNANPVEGPQVSLPLQAFMAVRSPQPEMIARGFGTAAFLLMLVLVLFVIARIIGGRGPGHLSGRQRRRIARESAADLRRFAARAGAVGLALAVLGVLVVRPTGPAYAEDYVPISGAGSTWSQNALDQWRRNVNQYGMQVNYQGTGSSDGRNQFRNGTVDFAVSEIPYGLTDGGVKDDPPNRKYAYMPIVAGGTSFMYNLKIGGQKVTNLRLSGENVVKIFTGVLKSWDDPAIKADNPGLALPARPIIPVVRSDGSGTTAQLTTYFAKRHGALWDAYCKKAGRNVTPCGVTSSYPVLNGSGMTAQATSLGVSGYVSQAQNEGTITYVEYSYALNTNMPVVKLLNKSGYYVGPTAENVAVGLLKAQINNNASSPDYLTQILDGVYDNPDKRAYPLSSYSYMVLPTAAEGSFNTAKGKTLGDFAYYFLCEGQQQAPVLGYSPLPINLVQAGLSQIKRIPGVDVQTVDIAKCNNPTFSKTGENLLASTAPYPEPCDKKGPTQCGTGIAAPTKKPTKSASGNGATDPTGTTTNTPGATTVDPSTGVPIEAPAATTVDPDTGQQVPIAGEEQVTGGSVVSGTPQNVSAGYSSGMQTALMILAGLVLLLVVLAPPVVAQLVARRKP